MAHIAIDARIINSTSGRYVERLLTYLQEIDRENTYSVLVREKDQNYWKPKYDNFSVLVAEFDQFSLAEQLGFKAFLDRLKPDLVHFGIIQQPILYRGKKMTTVHDMTLLKTYNSDKNWFVYHFKQLVGRFVFNEIARTNNRLIAITEFTKKDTIHYTNADPKKISVVYESADVASGGTKTYKLPYKNYILYVGNQSDYKNIRKLGDAHQELLKQYPDLGLVLVGSKNKAAQNVESYFIKKKYKNILYTGFVSDQELNWLYTHAKAYVFPSLMEGFGLPGLEAMGQGAPVVSSNATCLPEVYGDAAHYFDPTSTPDMVRAITEVLGNEKLRQSLSKKGYEQIKKYSWKKMAQETHAIYLKVLRSKN